jgi:hypothetical protein
MVSDFEIKIHYHMQISVKAGGTGKQHGLISFHWKTRARVFAFRADGP